MAPSTLIASAGTARNAICFSLKRKRIKVFLINSGAVFTVTYGISFDKLRTVLKIVSDYTFVYDSGFRL